MEAWFSRGLQDWYHQNKRDLPWRNEEDPYRIWLSEIILQQTQVIQGLNYYNRFIKNYPAIKDLAKAPEDKILKDWQGLGYYSRARNLHAAAKTIVAEHEGIFPNNFEAIRKLKGIGDYTAAAISSFAFGLKYAVVDGNVYRLLSRVFGISAPIDSGAGKKEFKAIADALLDTNNPADYNQAIMEFGSQYCKPANPDCANCIFSKKCFAFKNNMVLNLPVKGKKTKIRNRFFNYIVARDAKNNFLVRKRGSGDIWQGLYEFPLIETESHTESAELLNRGEIKSLVGENAQMILESKVYKHILSHQHLHARFFVFESQEVFQKNKCNRKDIPLLAFPRLIEKFIDDSKSGKTAVFLSNFDNVNT